MLVLGKKVHAYVANPYKNLIWCFKPGGRLVVMLKCKKGVEIVGAVLE